MAPKRRKIPAEPSGRVGPKRPDNKPRRKSSRDVNELGKDNEPDARFGDERQPESGARDHPGGAHPPAGRAPRYRNTDEGL
jgi:hypothetical protein